MGEIVPKTNELRYKGQVEFIYDRSITPPPKKVISTLKMILLLLSFSGHVTSYRHDYNYTVSVN